MTCNRMVNGTGHDKTNTALKDSKTCIMIYNDKNMTSDVEDRA
mgnify:CR=1 FL=1